MIEVILVEDSDKVRQRLCAALRDYPSIRVVGEYEDADAAVAGILATPPDVVILDIKLKTGHGLSVLERVKRRLPQVTFMVFTNYAETVYRERYRGAGADFFFDKATESDQLLEAICRLKGPPPGV